VVSEFGGLDLLVSNAGIEHFGALETITQADFDRLFQAWLDSKFLGQADRSRSRWPGGRDETERFLSGFSVLFT
jgi:NAD(P)-dependent dehydrogenase (short-subunit alcohol dehydrogenase family)